VRVTGTGTRVVVVALTVEFAALAVPGGANVVVGVVEGGTAGVGSGAASALAGITVPAAMRIP